MGFFKVNNYLQVDSNDFKIKLKKIFNNFYSRLNMISAEYIDKVLTRLTFWGGLNIMLVCLIPEFMILYFRVPFYFGGTSLLIIVVVAMDFMAQLQALMMSKQYEGLMKKANLKNYGRGGQPR